MSTLVSPATLQPFPTQDVPGGTTQRVALNTLALCETAAGAVTVKRPLGRSQASTFSVQDNGNNASVNNITIDGDGDLIDGSPSVLLTSGEPLVYVFDDGQWRRLLANRVLDPFPSLVQRASDGVDVGPVAPSPIVGSVANQAALGLVDGAPLNDQSQMLVRTYRQYWVLDKGSTAALQPNRIIAAVGGGRWSRLESPVPFWTNQLVYAWDPALGDDEGTGLAGAPLLTFLEFNRRVRRALANTEYRLDLAAGSTASATDDIRWNPDLAGNAAGGNSTVRIRGVTTNAVVSAVTAASAAAPAAGTGNTITDAATVWAAQIGQNVVMTSGPAVGAEATVGADLGAGVALVSDFVFRATGVVAPYPAAGNTFVIRAKPSILSGFGGRGLASRGRIFLEDINYTAPAGIAPVGDEQFFACRFTSAISTITSQLNFSLFFACAMHLPVLGPVCSYTNPEGMQWFGGAFINCIVQLTLTGGVVLRSLFVNSHIRQSAASNVAGGNITIASPTAFFAVPPGVPAIDLSRGMRLVIQPSAGATGIYGVGTGTSGVRVREGSDMLVPTGCTPQLSCTTELDFEGSPTAIPALVAGAAVPASSPLTTWAQYKAPPFSGNVVSYTTGSRIFSTS